MNRRYKERLLLYPNANNASYAVTEKRKRKVTIQEIHK